MLMAYLGGFSTVLYVLKLAISCCIPTKVFEKERSLSFTMVPSIHAKRSVIILSYSSFKFSISTRMPIILGRKVTKVSQKKRSSCADHLYLVQTSPSCLFSLHLWKVMIIGDKVSHNRLVIRFSHRKIWRERKREEEVVILETSPFCTVPTFLFHKTLFHIMRKKQVFSRLGYCHLSHAWTGLTVTLPSASSSLGRPSSLSAMSNALLRQAMGSFGFRASKSTRSGLWTSHTVWVTQRHHYSHHCVQIPVLVYQGIECKSIFPAGVEVLNIHSRVSEAKAVLHVHQHTHMSHTQQSFSDTKGEELPWPISPHWTHPTWYANSNKNMARKKPQSDWNSFQKMLHKSVKTGSQYTLKQV